MTPVLNIPHRRPVWMAISMFYLDTMLEEDDFKKIAAVIAESPYSLEEVKAIDRYEVYPVLQANLYSIAGEYAGFDEEFVVERIMTTFVKKTALQRFGANISYRMNKYMHKTNWRKLEAAYNELK